MDDETRALFCATELRAHLLTLAPPARKRLLDAILENVCRVCAMPADHSFCDGEWDPPVVQEDEEPYAAYAVAEEPKRFVDARDYAGYYCYVKGQPRSLEEWKRR